MSKSKSRNRKRSQMLRQRKKEREFTEKRIKSYGIPEKEKKLKAQLGREVKIRNKDTSGEKISDMVLQLMEPWMKQAMNFEEEKDIIRFGIIAWNLGVIKACEGETEMLKISAGFEKDFKEEMMGILMGFVETKCTEYEEYEQFIYDYEYSRKGRRGNYLTVVYEPVQEKQ